MRGCNHSLADFIGNEIYFDLADYEEAKEEVRTGYIDPELAANRVNYLARKIADAMVAYINTDIIFLGDDE